MPLPDNNHLFSCLFDLDWISRSLSFPYYLDYRIVYFSLGHLRRLTLLVNVNKEGKSILPDHFYGFLVSFRMRREKNIPIEVQEKRLYFSLSLLAQQITSLDRTLFPGNDQKQLPFPRSKTPYKTISPINFISGIVPHALKWLRKDYCLPVPLTPFGLDIRNLVLTVLAD